MNKNGNVMMISIIFIAIIITIFLFIMLIFISQVNSLLYNIKLDMYSINKSAIISVNKGITSREYFSYDKNEYKNYLKEMLRKNYGLNESLENEEGIVRQAKIIECEVYSPGYKDSHTGAKVKDTTIHSVIEVRIRPIILEELLEKYFVFEIHEDVALNALKTSEV